MILPIHSRSSKLTLSIIYTLYSTYYCAGLKFNQSVNDSSHPVSHFNNTLSLLQTWPYLSLICMRI